MKQAILQCGIHLEAPHARSNPLIPHVLETCWKWSVACDGKRQMSERIKDDLKWFAAAAAIAVFAWIQRSGYFG